MTTLKNALFAAVVAGAITGIGRWRVPSMEIASTSLTPTVEGQQSTRLQTGDLPQASILSARHRSGQTFLTWKEAIPVFDEVDATVHAVIQAKKQFDKQQRVSYRIYRSDRPITSLDGLTYLAEVPPLTGWNLEHYGIAPKATDKAFRYVIEDGGQPVAPHTGIYVVNPAKPGLSYYAVTAVLNGRENRSVSPANVLVQAVSEHVGRGDPILQRVRKPRVFAYVENPTLEYYVRWEAPPNSSVPGRPFDYLVGLPANMKSPAPVGIHLHCYGANLESCFGWWFNSRQGAVLIASNNLPQDWWTGYPDQWSRVQTSAKKEDWEHTVVRPYTQQRMLSFLDFAARRYNLDLTRVFTGGISMGGSGALMMAIRRPDRIAWAIGWVGVHRPAESPTFRNSYRRVFGDPGWAVRFEDGTPVWDYYDNVKYLRDHVAQDVGFITFSNGKNDGDIGWRQAVDFYRALQETRQPHLFVWGQQGHGERARMPVTGSEQEMPLDLRVDQSLPAFTRGSLDDNPGNGARDDGDPSGRVNAYLFWETESIEDTEGVWKITVGLTPRAPRDDCRVDVTPRRLQRFKTTPGERLMWTNTRIGQRTPFESGEVVADQWGLVTLEKVTVHKGRNTIRVTRASVIGGGRVGPAI
jgi:pimeloyl-ACP methyl ester carboxylesterase